MTPLEKYRQAVTMRTQIASDWGSAAKAVNDRFAAPMREAERTCIRFMMDLTMGEVLETTIRSKLSIVEKITIGANFDRRIGDIIPAEMQRKLFDTPRPVHDVLAELLNDAAHKERAATIDHDMRQDPAVSVQNVPGLGTLYGRDFNSPEELFQFMSEKMGVSVEEAKRIVENTPVTKAQR